MEIKPEVPTPHNPAGVTPPNGGESVVTLSKAEFDSLKSKADVSSQNFERLKKTEEENQRLADELAASKSDPLFTPPTGDEAVSELSDRLSKIETENAKLKVIELHPQLKEIWSDFETFRADENNKGMNMNTAAKAFMLEKGLLDPQRPGLEKPTGGNRTPQPTGMTVEEITKLRTTNYKKYSEMVRKGLIVVPS